MGGPYSTVRYEKLIPEWADAVALGEGEETCADFLIGMELHPQTRNDLGPGGVDRIDGDRVNSRQSWSWTGRTFNNFIDIVRHANFFQVPDHGMNFVVGDKRAMHAGRNRDARRQVQHVTVAEQIFGTHLIQDRARIDFR